VAVYQTDVAAFAGFYRLGLGRAAAWRWLRRVHGVVGRTLARSSAAAAHLAEHGVTRVHRWPRGVDAARFHSDRRDAALRDRLAPDGETLVGTWAGSRGEDRRVAGAGHRPARRQGRGSRRRPGPPRGGEGAAAGGVPGPAQRGRARRRWSAVGDALLDHYAAVAGADAAAVA
jgi:phosphatidylinositol alpha 1,6-mannosyltransferase